MSIKINGTNYDSTIDQTYEEAGQVYTGAHHLASNPELYQPQGTNHFYFYVDFNNDSAISQGDEESLRLSVRASSVPHFTQGIIETNVGNETIKFAGKRTFADGTIEVYDWIGANTKRILMDWQRKSYNVRTGKVGLASDYKKTAYLVETTPDGQVVRSFKIYGCWISGLSEDNHTWENGNDMRVITATITYDYADVE